jgi:hypothetical protein
MFGSQLISSLNKYVHLTLRSRREIEREEKVGGGVRHYIEKGRTRANFTAMKVPRQCPLVLLVKVGWRGGKSFGCKEGIDERRSRERS